MSAIIKGLQLCAAVVRIKCYQLFKKPDPPSRPHYDLIAVGLTGAGKTTTLATLSGEDPVEGPTNGFAIKAVQLDNVVFNVKELGGSEKFRMYWDKYYDNLDGIIFVFDVSADKSSFEAALKVLVEVESHAALERLPLFVLGTKTDRNSVADLTEVTTAIRNALSGVDSRRLFDIAFINATDTKTTKAAFNSFATKCYAGANDEALE